MSLAAGLLAAVPAQAAPDNSGPVIAEAYTNGGSANAPYTHKFVELRNPTSTAISLSGWSIQYRSATGTSTFLSYPLSGSIPANGTYLIRGGTNGSNGVAVPNVDVETGLNPAGTGGTIALVKGTAAISPAAGSVVTTPNWSTAGGVVDLLGYGNSNTFEASPSAAPSANNDPKSIVRNGTVDTDVNSADFTLSSTVTPCGSAGCGGGTDPGTPEVATIAEIQGEGAASPFVDKNVTTEGVVVASYPTGGLNGVYLQTTGTGGAHDRTATASHGIFVFSQALAAQVQPGQLVSVTGKVTEYFGLTQITPAANGWTLKEGPAQVLPTPVEFPISETEREALEGMLVQLDGDFTVTNNYDTHTFGEIGLAAGTEPLIQPTEVVAPGSAEYTQLVADNFAKSVTLDDGSGANFSGATGRDVPQTWLNGDNEVRVGAAVELTEPLVLDYRFDTWRVQPTATLTATGPKPAVIEQGLRAAEEKPEDVGGDLQLASFNVLNYFTTTGQAWVASGAGTCTYYNDRTGAPVNNNRCDPNGPRGAANAENLERQQVKIVNAINTLGADVVGLAEIENSAAFGLDRNAALETLVAALNADTGEETWAAVESPAVVPAVGTTDVITSAFIYRVDAVETVGGSSFLDDPAFVNARAPLAQAFRPVGGDEASTFLVIANHFKSKSSGSGEDADAGDGQSASNASRVKQATALVGFVDDLEAAVGTDQTFLVGDFNSYSKEDPVGVLEDAGFVNVGSALDAGATYLFQGRVGSLDHVFASTEAFDRVTGADTWDINADEPIGHEYSRYNTNATLIYDDSVFRSSDHDPTLVGYDPVVTEVPDTTDPVVELSGPTTVIEGEDATFTVAVTDDSDITSVEYSVNAGEWTAVTDGTFTLSDLAVGSYEVEVRATDAADNVGTDSASLEVTEAPQPPLVFDDVEGNTFSAEIAWLSTQGITTGYLNADGSSSFRPSEPVLREQMAAFLYRFDNEGTNPPASAPNATFTDAVTNTFSKHIAWLADRGITTGYADNTFRPGQPVLREQMAAFLYRLAGSPIVVVPETSPFADIPTTHTFYKQIVWLASTDITTGYAEADGSTTFKGSQPVLREQMAAFLFRFDNLSSSTAG
ncbi:hypothetical protein GCM10009710_34700 [Aeromicrobium alkaliterrae]|uniref:ExeM/NucH family extracellular endonuclease n=1 Tax=Aeromicrobium alkaliterrae TaxID=302168 RepID=A0ABN2KAX7_9ACTN